MIRRIGAGEISLDANGVGALAKLDPGGGKGPQISTFYEGQRAVTLEWMNEAVSIARRPSPEQALLWKEWQARRDKVKESRQGRQSAAFARRTITAPMTGTA